MDEKSESDSGGFSHKNHQQENSKKDSDDKETEFQVTDENLEKAMKAFAGDLQAQKAGLKAETSGSGPGLKVILRDGSGAVIRQLTGEEFLRLRDAVAERETGKLLDQKL